MPNLLTLLDERFVARSARPWSTFGWRWTNISGTASSLRIFLGVVPINRALKSSTKQSGLKWSSHTSFCLPKLNFSTVWPVPMLCNHFWESSLFSGFFRTIGNDEKTFSFAFPFATFIKATVRLTLGHICDFFKTFLKKNRLSLENTEQSMPVYDSYANRVALCGIVSRWFSKGKLCRGAMTSKLKRPR